MEHLRNNKIVKSYENGHFWTFSKAPSMGNDPRYKPILRVKFWKGVKKKMKIQIRSLSQVDKLSQLISLRGLKEDLLFDKLDEVR